MTKQKQAERLESIKALKKYLRPGKQVYTIVTHVSRSGMSRTIRLYTVRAGELVEITWHVSKILGWRNTDKGLLVQGCGMDMGFHTVYSLGYSLYPKGFKLAKNQYGRNGDTSGYDKDGGYALKQVWM